MSGFAHDIAGGDGALIIDALHSPDYVPATTGWTVNQDGSAEFNDLVLRGTFQGNDFVLNTSGLFTYSGAAGPNTLIASEAGAAGTDPYGNAYLAGIASYQVISGAGHAAVSSAGAYTFYVSGGAGLAGPWNQENAIAPAVHQIGLAVTDSIGRSLFLISNPDPNNSEMIVAAEDPAKSGFAESWHTMPAFTTNWAHSGTGVGGHPAYGEYKLFADGTLGLRCSGLTTAAPGGSTGTQLCTLPAPYVTSQYRYFPAAWYESSIISGSNNSGGYAALGPAGDLWIYGGAPGVSGTNYFMFDARIARD